MGEINILFDTSMDWTGVWGCSPQDMFGNIKEKIDNMRCFESTIG